MTNLGRCGCQGVSGLGQTPWHRSPVFIVAMGLASLGVAFYFTRQTA
jgi:hypothetical protein